jgi:hypothetical protein
MTTVSEPRVNFPIVGANTAVPNAAQRALVLGQMTSAGTATAGELNVDVQDSNWDTLFGAGGMLPDWKDNFRLINKVTPVDVIALDDPTGTASAGAILWDGTATEAGSFEVCGGSERNGKATVTVAIGDTSDDVATATTAAFASLTSAVFTVTTDGVTTDQNNFTYNHDGAEGNYGTIYVTGTVAGITYGITGYTGGTGVPTLTNVFDVVGTQRYQTVVIPGSYGVTEVAAFLDDRWNVDNRILDGVCIVTLNDAYADHISALGLLNSLTMVRMCRKEESASWYKGGDVAESPFAQSAQIAAARALRLTPDVDVSDLVDSRGGSLDSFGGPALCSLPYFNTPLQLPLVPTGMGFSDTQAEAIKAAGGSVSGNNIAGTAHILGEMSTTYKTDSQGSTDLSFKYLNSVDTNSTGREYMFNQIKRDCSQDRMTTGATIAGRRYKNVQAVRTLFKKYYGILSGKDWCVTEAGEEALLFFENNLTVTADKTTGTFTATMIVPIVVQTRNILATWQMSF